MKHALCVSAARLGYVVVVVGLVLLTLGIGEATTTADGKAIAGGTASAFTAAAWMASEVGSIDDEVLRLALGASRCAVSRQVRWRPRER